MKSKLFLTILILFIQHFLFGQLASPSQGKATFYYNLSWELTTKEKSFFRREANFDFVEMVFDGLYKDYNKDDKMIGEGLYAHGVKRGLQTEYFNDRSLKSTIEYLNNDFTIWELKNEKQEVVVKGGTGKFTVYYLYVSGLVSQPVWKEGILNGEFNLGRREGIWTYQDINKKPTDEEVYSNAKLIKRVHYSDNATVELDYKKEINISINSLFTDAFAFDHTAFTFLSDAFDNALTYPASLQRNITYPGGIKRLLLLLAQNAEIPGGSVFVVKLKMDDHGRVLKYRVMNSVGQELDNRALKLVQQHENRFLPAIRDGKPHAASISLPISSGQEWVDQVNATPIEEMVLFEN